VLQPDAAPAPSFSRALIEDSENHPSSETSLERQWWKIRHFFLSPLILFCCVVLVLVLRGVLLCVPLL
jgi:hypothetical protein